MFEHGGWTEATAAVREKFGDWPVMLDRFAALATSTTSLVLPSAARMGYRFERPRLGASGVAEDGVGPVGRL
jgi:hypothetical protein